MTIPTPATVRTVALFCLAGALLIGGPLRARAHSSSGPSDERLEAPHRLRCEYREAPLGMDVKKPRLSWAVGDTSRGAMQSAYQIQVAGSPKPLANGEADVWDSGKVESDQSIQVPYDGPVLQSGERYWWRVRTWNEEGDASAWSDARWWEMGLLEESDWQANWISSPEPLPQRPEQFYEDDPAPLFRKGFSLEKQPERARLYVSGLGYYEARLNGEKVGERVLDPGWTSYDHRTYYSTYDVTGQLREGDNALGVMLGNGWYNPRPLQLFGQYNLRDHLTVGRPRLIAQLVVDYADGTREVIASGEDWQVGEGPIVRNGVYLGEHYDARKEQPGWARPGFEAEGWNDAVRAEATAQHLAWQPQPAIKVTKRLEPTSVTEVRPDTFVVDFGQNFAGWVKMRAPGGPRGTRINLFYGELLHTDGAKEGLVNGFTSVAGHIKERWGLGGGPGAPPTAWQEDTFILDGEGAQTFRPHFTFHGFRYAQVTGWPEDQPPPTKEDFTGLRLSADLDKTGSFASSSALFTKIQEMTEWTFLSNVFGIQSDCPHREKFAYGGDIVASAEAFLFNYGMGGFYTKTARDFAADQRPNGGMPETAPYNGIAVEGLGGGSGPVGWQLAHPSVQEKMWRFYGDRRLLEEQYAATKRTVEFLRARAGDDGLIEKGISDHASVDPKPVELTSAAFYYKHARLLAGFAERLGKADDAREYGALAEEIKAAFQETFFKPQTDAFGFHTQASQLFALDYGLAPPEQEQQALDVLLAGIKGVHGGHLSTGIFGTEMLFDVLRRQGHSEVAYDVATRRDYPGWGKMLDEGATTLWEFWRGGTGPSHNHPMFGSISEWFYRTLAGINPAPGAVGFDEIVIAPRPVGDLKHARGHYDSIRGEISSRWETTGSENGDGGLTLDVTIPANATAEVRVPTLDREAPTVRESGTVLVRGGERAGSTEAVEFVRMGERGAAVFDVGAGQYRFSVE
jgi:alpha-L-rhamnosidase